MKLYFFFYASLKNHCFHSNVVLRPDYQLLCFHFFLFFLEGGLHDFHFLYKIRLFSSKTLNSNLFVNSHYGFIHLFCNAGKHPELQLEFLVTRLEPVVRSSESCSSVSSFQIFTKMTHLCNLMLVFRVL